jgi:hypothetical protein
VDEVSKREEIEEPRVRGAGGGSKGNWEQDEWR